MGHAEATANNTGTTLTLALNYGSRSEIVDAVRSILTDLTTEAHTRGCSVEDLLGVGAPRSPLDESSISDHLYTAHMPDPDLVIRTSGEQRISNFLLWQIAYSEIFITDRLWPDFRGLHLLEAIAELPEAANAASEASARPSPTKTSTPSSPPKKSPPRSRTTSIPKALPKPEAKSETKADPVLTRR